MIEPLEGRIAPSTLLSAFRLANATSSPSVVGTDSQGNVIVVGRFFGGFEELPPGVLETNDAGGDIFVAKYSAADQTRLWAVKYGGTGSESPVAIAFDAADNIFVTGSFSGPNFNFNGPAGGISAVGNEDVFLFKAKATDGTPDLAFGANGLVRWGGDDTGLRPVERPASIAVDSPGAVIVAGSFVSQAAGFGGPTTVAASGIDGFIFKVSGANGAPVAGFGTGGMVGTTLNGDDGFGRVVVDSDNNLFLTTIDTAGANQADGIIKVSGANGSVVTSFGTLANGRIPLGIHPAALPTQLDVAIDRSDRVVTMNGSIAFQTMIVQRFDHLTGARDLNFNSTGPVPGVLEFPFISAAPAQLDIDSLNQIYVSGNNANSGLSYVLRISKQGITNGTILATSTTGLDATIDAQDRLILRGTYAGSPDLDPTNGKLKLPARGGLNANMTDGYVVRVDPYSIDAANPLTVTDASGDLVTVRLTGAGRAHYSLLNGGSAQSNLDALQLIGTNLTTKLAVSVPTNTSTIGSIQTGNVVGAPQDVGSIRVGANITLGSELTTELLVSGRMNELVLGDIAANVLIQLGTQLPYDDPDPKVSDTYNNRPSLTIGDVLGGNVRIENIGDGMTPGAVGGGGFGNIVVGSWAFAGFLRTTQSIGDFTVLNAGGETFMATLEIDSLGLGDGTTASTGAIRAPMGRWGSPDSRIDGGIESLSVEEFLAGATLTAASIGKILVDEGGFLGTLILTDPDSPAIPTFIVNGHFTGNVDSEAPIRKLKIKGDFGGSLRAPFIGSISAYTFTGVANTTFIEATDPDVGSLGTLTATQGGISNYKLVTQKVFKGIKVNLTGLTESTVGLENVDITAASIGNIAVTLKANATASTIDLVGIKGSQFKTTATGSTKSTAGTIGNISVTLTGAKLGSSSIGIQDSSFDALVGLATPTEQDGRINSVGNISVKLSAQGGTNVGVQNAIFAGNTIGKTTVSVNRSLLVASTGKAINTANYTASGAIGAFAISGNATSEQVNVLKVWSGENIGAVTVKSSNTGPVNFGTLKDSAIAAGQLLDDSFDDLADQTRKLALAKLGAITVSGSILNSDLVAGGSIGAVVVGHSLTDSLIVAGARLGGEGDFALDGDESYQRAATIASIMVKGTTPTSFARTSIAAGIDPGADFSFGNADTAALAAIFGTGPSLDVSRIGPVSLAGAVSGEATVGSHQYAIEAGILASVKAGTQLLTSFTPAHFLDQTGNDDSADDVVLRVI